MLKVKKILLCYPIMRSVIFVAIGGVAYLIYAAALYSALQIFGWGMFGAVLFAYAMTIAFHFPANRYCTFFDRKAAIGEEFRRYAQVYVFSAFLAYLLSLLESANVVSWYWGYALPVISICITYAMSKNYIWASK